MAQRGQDELVLRLTMFDKPYVVVNKVIESIQTSMRSRCLMSAMLPSLRMLLLQPPQLLLLRDSRGEGYFNIRTSETRRPWIEAGSRT